MLHISVVHLSAFIRLSSTKPSIGCLTRGLSIHNSAATITRKSRLLLSTKYAMPHWLRQFFSVIIRRELYRWNSFLTSGLPPLRDDEDKSLSSTSTKTDALQSICMEHGIYGRDNKSRKRLLFNRMRVVGYGKSNVPAETLDSQPPRSQLLDDTLYTWWLRELDQRSQTWSTISAGHWHSQMGNYPPKIPPGGNQNEQFSNVLHLYLMETSIYHYYICDVILRNPLFNHISLKLILPVEKFCFIKDEQQFSVRQTSSRKEIQELNTWERRISRIEIVCPCVLCNNGNRYICV